MTLLGPAALLALSTYGRTYNPGAWWLVALLASLAVRTCSQRASRPIERRFARVVGLLAVAWLSLAWQTGPYQLPLVVPLAVLAPVFGATWAAYRWSRTLPTIDWPSSRGHARNMRALHAYAREMRSALRLQIVAMRRFAQMRRTWGWTSRLREVGLPDSTLATAHWAPSGPVRVLVELSVGKTLEDVRTAVPALEVEWRLRPGTLRPNRGSDGLAHEVVLEFRSVAEMTPPPAMLVWPGKPPRTVREPVHLGEFAGRRRVAFLLVDKDGRLAPHVQVTGQTGKGKGSFVNCLLAETALLAEVEHRGIDAKGGLELGPWTGLFTELAEDGDQAVALLERLQAEMKRRWGVMREAGIRAWVPTSEQPLIEVVVDEWAALPVKAKDLLDALLPLVRATGIWFVLCTQRASAAKTGGSGQTGDAKSQLGVTVSYYMPPGDEDLSFGEASKRAGWRTDLLDRPGLALIRWPGRYDSPEPFQTYWLDDERVAEVRATALAVRAPRPQPSDAVASAERGASVRSLPPSAEPARIAESRPALHLVDADASEDPLDRLRGLLAAAPEEGVERAELIARTGMSDSWVDLRLREERAAGQAVKVARARWRRPGSPSVVAMRSS